MKLKFRVEEFKPAKMVLFAEWCGWTLARAHARSGEPGVISGYLGQTDQFDRAVAAFALAYADQVERDHERFTQAVREGKLEARTDEDV
jgi:NAD(P)H-dependent flavin oxidoreductase YrpB (nitropropane dioxygenase family)